MASATVKEYELIV